MHTRECAHFGLRHRKGSAAFLEMSEAPIDIGPPGFPTAEWRRMQKIAARRSGDEAWPEAAGGWNGVRFRFAACVHHDDAFGDALRRFGDAPPIAEREHQERELAGFFTAAQSTIECAMYALYGYGRIIEASAFGAKPHGVTPALAAATYEARFAGEHLTSVIRNVIDAPEFEIIRECRRVLFHRAAPGRTFFAAAAGEGALWKLNDLPFAPPLTADRRTWVEVALRELVPATVKFFDARF
jgi:hypothetical protein